jgi:hypothetical protein
MRARLSRQDEKEDAGVRTLITIRVLKHKACILRAAAIESGER